MKFQDNQHFSHHHILVCDLKLEKGEKIKCSGCQNSISEPFHGCLSCHYYLHDDCFKAPRALDHPSHPSHPLTLLPNPTYSTRSFTCDACRSQGKAFSYCCSHCEFDIHTTCAALPITLLTDGHHHELKLIFGSPYEDPSTLFECNVCHGLVDFWRYYCHECDYGTHLNCATLQEQSMTQARKGQEEEEEEEEEAKPGKGQGMTPEEKYRKAPKDLMEQHLANKLMLQALDNASGYVGSSRRRRDYTDYDYSYY